MSGGSSANFVLVPLYFRDVQVHPSKPKPMLLETYSAAALRMLPNAVPA